MTVGLISVWIAGLNVLFSSLLDPLHKLNTENVQNLCSEINSLIGRANKPWIFNFPHRSQNVFPCSKNNVSSTTSLVILVFVCFIFSVVSPPVFCLSHLFPPRESDSEPLIFLSTCISKVRRILLSVPGTCIDSPIPLLYHSE